LNVPLLRLTQFSGLGVVGGTLESAAYTAFAE